MALARSSPVPVAALGGISGAGVRRLPRICRAIGAIGALTGGRPSTDGFGGNGRTRRIG
jgi:hypothetical protein